MSDEAAAGVAFDSAMARGDSLHAMGRLPEAAQAYRQAVIFDPGHAVAQHSLALVLEQR